MSEIDIWRAIQELQEEISRLKTPDALYRDSGSFTPVWVGTGTAGTFTYTANVNLVEWTVISNTLFYRGRLSITAITVAPTLNLTITGWPYPGVSDANLNFAGGGTFTGWAINTAAGYTQVGLQFANGSSVANLVESGDNLAPANVQGGELIVGSCRFAGHYQIA